LELQGENEVSDIASHLLFRTQDKNKQYPCCNLFFLFFKLHLKTDIGFRVQFTAEFPGQVMNFPIKLNLVNYLNGCAAVLVDTACSYHDALMNILSNYSCL